MSSANRATEFALGAVPPPASLWLIPESWIGLAVWNSAASAAIRLRGRMIAADGRHVLISELLTPTTDRVRSFTTLRPGEGFLFQLTAFEEAGAPLRGQTWVELSIGHGREVFANRDAILARDYLAGGVAVAFPGGPIRSSVEGPGALRSITGTDPAAGAEISETVPTNARWRLHSLRAQFLADATAATRRPTLVVDDGTTMYGRFGGVSVNVVAGQSMQISFAPVGENVNISGIYSVVSILNEPLLLAGHRFRTITISIQAGDNWGVPQFLVEEWIEE